MSCKNCDYLDRWASESGDRVEACRLDGHQVRSGIETCDADTSGNENMEFQIGDKVKVIGAQSCNRTLINIIGTVISIYKGKIYEVGFSDNDVKRYRLRCNSKSLFSKMYNWKFYNDSDGDVTDKLQKVETQKLYLI